MFKHNAISEIFKLKNNFRMKQDREEATGNIFEAHENKNATG